MTGSPQARVRPLPLLLKALLIFLVFNLLFAWADPPTGAFVLINHGLPGYERFPALWVPDTHADGSVSFERELISDIDLLFASHVISAGPKAADEYRVLVFGDSSVWGTALYPDETLAGVLNRMDLRACDGRRVVAYNLGYPSNSATKDLVFMQYAQRYQPDLQVWMFSMLAFYPPRQDVPFTDANPDLLRALIEQVGLPRPVPQVPDGLYGRTILGRRQDLSLAVRLHFSTLTVLARGLDDMRLPTDRLWELTDAPSADPAFLEIQPGADLRSALAFYTLDAAAALSPAPILYVNEPVMVSAGEHSDISYNSIYPRWAYDSYRAILAETAAARGWTLLDLWDLAGPEEFSTSIFHIKPAAEARLAQQVAEAILAAGCR